jgi:enoyl-CoA hydratase/carnithine racemase
VSLSIASVGDAVVLTIDRPEARNAIDLALAKKLAAALRLASQDPKARGVVLAAEGPVFLSGGDLKSSPPTPRTAVMGARCWRCSTTSWPSRRSTSR